MSSQQPSQESSQAVSMEQEMSPIRVCAIKKQKRNNYTVKEKIVAVQRLANGEQAISIAADLHITTSMLYKWRKHFEVLSLVDKKRKKNRKLTVSHPILTVEGENAIIKRINDLREAMVPVNGVVMRVFALQEAKNRNILSFKASNRWFELFTKRHNLVVRRGTKRVPKLSEGLMKELLLMQRTIYITLADGVLSYKFFANIDETPVVFGLSFDETFSKRGDVEVLLSKPPDDKKRITVILGIIQANHIANQERPPKVFKMKPMIIVKGKTERCLKSLSTFKQDKEILLRYQEKSWCTEKLYIDFIRNAIPNEIQKSKILITHDNFKAHVSTAVNLAIKDLGYGVYCLPANSTYACQPLDVALNKPFKQYLKQEYTNYLIENAKTPKTIYSVTPVHVVEWVKKAWAKVDDEQIRTAFKCCGYGIHPDDTTTPIYWKSLQSLKKQLDTIPQQQNQIPGMASLLQNVFSNEDIGNSHPNVFLYDRYIRDDGSSIIFRDPNCRYR